MEQYTTLNQNQKLIIALGFMFVIVLSSILIFSLSVLVFQIIMGMITIYFCFKTDYKTAKLWLSIFCISILFVFLVFYANQLYYGKPYYIGGSDDLNYERQGLSVYKSGVYNPSKVMELEILGKFHNSPFFAVYIAILINFADLFGGYTTFLPRIANAYFLVWICMIIKYLLTKYTNLSNKAIYYSLVLFAFMPHNQYINAHVFRDTLNLLQVLLIVLLFDFLLRETRLSIKIFSIILLPIIIYFTYYTRVNSILFAGVIILLSIFTLYRIKLYNKIKLYKNKRYYIIIGIILFLLLGYLLKVFRVDYYIKTYSSYVSNIAGEGLSRIVFNTPLLPFGIVLRILYAFIFPFPNFFLLFMEKSKLMLDIIQLFIYLGVLIQICAVPFIIKRTLKFDWLSLAFWSWFLAIIVSTFTFRHFLFFYPFMSAVAVDGFFKTSIDYRKRILFITILTVIVLGIVYVVLKIFC